MNRKLDRYVTVVFVGLLATICQAGRDAALAPSQSASSLASADSRERRKYAADHGVQMLHLNLDVTPDFQQRSVRGTATLRFKPILKPVREVRLDAVDLNVDSVSATERVQGYQATKDKVIVTFAEELAPGREATVTIAYRAEPSRGLYFRTPEMGYKAGDTHLFTQGEEIEARHWYPCFDSPNVKCTSEVICRVPEGMTVISNGRLVSQTNDPATALTVFHWSQEQPHANYLITLVAGYFSKLEARHAAVPLGFYTPPSEFHTASNSFRCTPEIMAFFDQEIGIAYPWAKYDQICVNDFVAGGMENTSATTLTDGTLFTEATENLRDSEGLVAHEMAHQWFGDLVTCKDWSDTWLNEGFATYYESLYRAHKHGVDAMRYELYHRAREITRIPNDTVPIVRRDYNVPGDMFGYLTYPKASWVLHMLRTELGEELYRHCVKTYLERHRYGSVTTEDFRSVIEESSGRSYDQFFDQWLYHAHHPELEVGYSWDETARLAHVSVRQVQKLSDAVLLFNLPLTVRFKGKIGTVDRVIRVQEKEEDFSFQLESAPELVRLDPDYTLLAKVTFAVPNAMLSAQLADREDMIGRLLAIEQFASRKDKESVAKLKEVLNNDPFHGVRIEASQALRSIHSDEALEALLASAKQKDARVRRQVVDDIGGFYRDTAYEFALATIEHEKNPAIIAVALEALGAYGKPITQTLLLRFLRSDSFRNELAVAAIDAMRLQDDPAYITPLLESLPQRESDFTSHGFAQGLGTLAYLARNEEKKERVRELLLGYVNHKRRTIQLASINALGALGDPKAIAALRTFASAAKESQQRSAAERAIASLRADRKPVDDFKNLRQEVLDLQQANRELRKDLEELKKKAATKQSPPAPPNTKAKQPAVLPAESR